MSKETETAATTAATTTTRKRKQTTREIRLKTEAVLEKGVTTRATLNEALPVLIALQNRIEALNTNLRQCRALAAGLSDACTAYVTARPSALEAGKFTLNQNGVSVGDVVIGSSTYHISRGFFGYQRVSGGLLTQDYLKGLPKGFVKSKLTLDVTAINAENLNESALAKYDLKDKPNDVWSLQPVAEGVAYGD